jgi:hypothetical protein
MKILNEIHNWSKCINPQIDNNENYFESYQKLYRDSENFIKYIIYIDHFIYRDLNHKLIAGARFRYKQDTIDIYYIIGEETTLKEVEEFFENVWVINHCEYES